MKKSSSFRSKVAALLILFFAAAFLLPAFRPGTEGYPLIILSGAVPAALLFLLYFPGGGSFLDRPLLSAVVTLSGFGMVALSAFSPDAALTQGMRCLPGFCFLLVGTVLIRSLRPSLPAAAVLLLFSIGMLVLPLFLPSLSFALPEGGTALLLFSAAFLLNLRLRLPALLAGLCGVLLLLFLEDYGSALVCSVSFMLLFWAVADSTLWSVIAAGALAGTIAGFFCFVPPVFEPAEFSLFTRIAGMPLLPPEAAPESFPADSLFLLLGDRFGLIFLLCSVVLLILILIRGTSIALHARKGIFASLALTAVLLLGLRSLLFLAVVTDLVPLKICEFPFLTFSLPSLFSDFFLIGILCGISGQNEADLEEDARLSMLAR